MQPPNDRARRLQLLPPRRRGRPLGAAPVTPHEARRDAGWMLHAALVALAGDVVAGAPIAPTRITNLLSLVRRYNTPPVPGAA